MNRTLLTRAASAALLCLLLLGFGRSASAQATAGGGLMVGVPIGEFSDVLNTVGFGATAHLMYAFEQAPVALGIEGGLMIYGHENTRVPLGSGHLGRVHVDVVTTNNIGLGHLVLRLAPDLGIFRPYVDGLVGFNYLWTESRIEDVRSDQSVFTSTNFSDFAFSYGGAAGFMVNVYDTASDQGRPVRVMVDARLRYLRGSEAEYLKAGSIREDQQGNLITTSERSRTDMLIPQVGVTVRF
jgi:hypothetical protein